jgi:hypothetical protein
MCPDQYPENFECVEGGCLSPGCASDADCAVLGIPGLQCMHLVGVHPSVLEAFCLPPCETDRDCSPLEACTGMTEEGVLVCWPKSNGPCECDAFCAVGGGVCNLDTGFCECTSDDDCAEDFACVPY